MKNYVALSLHKFHYEIEVILMCFYSNSKSNKFFSSRETDYECRSKETYYVCNETRTDIGKHEDETCNTYEEQCEGECKPGYMKCLIDSFPACGHPDKWVKCGDECKISWYYQDCDGVCIKNAEMCHGLCPTGYKECQGRCVSVSDSDFIDCNGTCQPISEPCEGKCSEGFFKKEGKCVSKNDSNSYYGSTYYECEGEWVPWESTCNGVCVGEHEPHSSYDNSTFRLHCRGDRCLRPSDRRPCEGEVCIHKDEHCKGKCP